MINLRFFFSKSLLLCLFLVAFNLQGQYPKLEWAVNFGNDNPEVLKAMALDGEESTILAGYYKGTVDFDPGADVFNLTSIDYQDVFITKTDAMGKFKWAVSIGNAYDVSVNAITTNSTNEIIISGTFNKTVDFDPGIGVYSVTALNYDQFVLCLNAGGDLVWVKTLGGNLSATVGLDITTDKKDKIYITGHYSGQTDFDPDTGKSLHESNRYGDAFILKLTSKGKFIWVKTFTGYTSGKQGLQIAVNKAGEIYTSGIFSDTVDFDPGTGVYNLIGFGSQYDDVYFSKLDSNGNFIWGKKIGGYFRERIYGLALDKSGNLYATGFYQGATDFDPGVAIDELYTHGSSNGDIFVLKLDADGNYVWARGIGEVATDEGRSIFVDDKNFVYVTGVYGQTVDFDRTKGPQLISGAAADDMFLLKLGTDGKFIWVKDIDEEDFSTVIPTDMVVTNSGYIHIGGTFSQKADFDPSIRTFYLFAGGTDAFVLKLSEDPNLTIKANNTIGPWVIWPNPNSGHFYIKTKSEINIKIYDEVGLLICSIETNESNNFTIEIMGISKGIYTIISNKAGSQCKGKLVVSE